MAANSDIAAGSTDIRLDLELNQLTTVAVLEAMATHGVNRLFFASTSAIFGETDAILHEDFSPLRPISFYGASKLAAEAYISVFAHTLGGRAVVLRFPNVVGERATHGVIYDFLRKLEADPNRLEVLGDGRQSKPYLYVRDLIDAILVAWDKSDCHSLSITRPGLAARRSAKSLRLSWRGPDAQTRASCLRAVTVAGPAMCHNSVTIRPDCRLWAGIRRVTPPMPSAMR